MVLFHGVLIATVCNAENLFKGHHRCSNGLLGLGGLCGLCEVAQCIKGALQTHHHHHHNHQPKLYVTLSFGEHATLARTRMAARQPNPEWQESFRIFCAHEVREEPGAGAGTGAGLMVKVKEDLALGARTVASCLVPAADLLSGQELEGWHDLPISSSSSSSNDPPTARGRLFLRLKFIGARDDPLVPWSLGLGHPALNSPLVQPTFFSQAKGNRIRLYQDAHTPSDFRPPISLRGGRPYHPARCWEDVYSAISAARHLIYITGWSVYTSITLIRDDLHRFPEARGVTLGELLKRKSEEGVRVLMLVWDDRTSVSVLGGALQTNGVMHTHDENTEAFFEGTKVQCVLCPRNPDDGSSLVEGIETGLMFTHHQKTVITDIPIEEAAAAAAVDCKQPYSSNARRLVAFVGGIDLCDGRYDTPQHSLFRTLGKGGVHEDDFHQTNFEVAERRMGGPREPWHDVHARVEGPCAWDILRNFEDRWKRQGRSRGRAAVRGPAASLVKVEAVEGMLRQEQEVMAGDEEEAWDAHVFRSIDEGAVVGFPQDTKAAEAMGLVAGKDHTIDRSIQDAYICAIRRAKHFIYMENQYFVGGATSWEKHADSGAQQLIPMELALKIVSKIKAGERFSVYVVIPMWPEGVPESASVQSILYWQRCTVEMMYRRIARAIGESREFAGAKPTDFLNFFCLGNREVAAPDEYRPTHPPSKPASHYALAQKHRRFMVYVHAKTMIVDDEYIIVGSANCNQRSMDGARDSEIAIGAYQPHHLTNGEETNRPEGQVHGFRLSLWYEHLGELHEDFKFPERIECVKRVQFLAKSFWNLYTQETVVNMPGHLLPYPLEISATGDVKPLRGYDTFPDTKAFVMGTHTTALPSILTV